MQRGTGTGCNGGQTRVSALPPAKCATGNRECATGDRGAFSTLTATGRALRSRAIAHLFSGACNRGLSPVAADAAGWRKARRLRGFRGLFPDISRYLRLLSAMVKKLQSEPVQRGTDPGFSPGFRPGQEVANVKTGDRRLIRERSPVSSILSLQLSVFSRRHFRYPLQGPLPYKRLSRIRIRRGR